MVPKKYLIGQLAEFLQCFENEWFFGFFTKIRIFGFFILLNFDKFCKFGCNSLEFYWIFDLKIVSSHKIPQLIGAKIKF